MRDIYQEVTDRIIAAIESGTNPWVRPWRDLKAAGNDSMPHNAITGRYYSGINLWLLMMSGYSSGGWLTYKQARERGGHVRRGEKGTVIVFWKFLKRTETNGDGEDVERTVPMARAYTVFNIEQCDGLTLPKRRSPKGVKLVDHERDEDVDVWVSCSGAHVEHGGNRAYYSIDADEIHMPEIRQFKNVESYYSTLLHELTHWTGHSDRMDRKFGKRFGSDAYAFEELIAELGASFQCAILSVNGQERHSSEYLAGWLKVLKNDKHAIFTAASQARQAVDWLKDKAGYLNEEAA